MLAMMRLCAPRSRQLLLTSCLLGHKVATSRLLLINPCCWNRTFATGMRNTGEEVPPNDHVKVKAETKDKIVEMAGDRAGKIKSGADKSHAVSVWSDEPISKLEELVAEHTIEPEFSESLHRMTKRTTDWATIGRLLAVDPEECKAKWKSIQDRGKKTGPFTTEEDALIAQRVAEWGDQGPGLWASLAREMGRDSGAISRRYKAVILLGRSSAWTFWTSAMDARLTEGVTRYKEEGGWAKVAAHVGGGVTALQCQQRWSGYVGKAHQKGIKQGDWSDEEMRQLEELVPHHVIKPYWSNKYNVMTQVRTDWTAIGKQLCRLPSECHYKWTLLLASRMKKGPFTAEEDALIRQRAAEWEEQGKPRGLWARLQREMDRPAPRIRARWADVLATRDLNWVPKESWEEQTFTPLLDRTRSRFQWTDFMDARLKEGVAKHKEKEGWAGIAKYVGGSVTAMQCMTRWHSHVSKVQNEGVRRGGWSDTEVEELLQLVPQHVVDSHWSDTMGVTTKESVDWIAIADKLNRIPVDCKNKWLRLKYSKLKKGRFTAEETALVLKRVAEWGNKGNGLWVSLAEEMGRDPEKISSHWRRYMKSTRPEPT